MSRKKHVCIVCGKMFPEGQGIVLTLDNYMLTFHSKACALKFFNTLLHKVSFDLIRDTVEDTVEEFKRKLREEFKRKAKKI